MYRQASNKGEVEHKSGVTPGADARPSGEHGDASASSAAHGHTGGTGGSTGPKIASILDLGVMHRNLNAH